MRSHQTTEMTRFSRRLIIILSFLGIAYHSTINATTVVARPAPEFTQTDPQAWIGSEPLSMADLRGNVVLIDFWTFSCWNCYRSFPWLNALEQKFEDDSFRVIGIHSPEFDHEKDRNAIEQNIKKYGLKHPSMMDNDFAYWRSIGNRFWPSFYLIDKRGNIRNRFIGETHEGDQRAQQIESAIKRLLAEAS